ncbi:hypothetical protein Tco_0083681 [Tanacetum coccineum]
MIRRVDTSYPTGGYAVSGRVPDQDVASRFGINKWYQSNHSPSLSQQRNTQPTPDAEEPVLMPHVSPLQSVHSLERDEGSMQQHELTNLVIKLTYRVAVLENDLQQKKKTYNVALTKLITRVKKLEKTIKTSKARRRDMIIVLGEEDAAKDFSKQEKRISDIDEDPNISLEKQSDDTEVLLEEEEPTKLVEDQGSGEKGQPEVTTTDTSINIAGVSVSIANIPISTATATPKISTARRIMYSRRSAEKRKDIGKAIMIEDESAQKKTKKQLEQERLRHEEAVRLQEQIDEEERQGRQGMQK